MNKKKRLVDQIVANSKGRIKANQKKVLMAMDEGTLLRMLHTSQKKKFTGNKSSGKGKKKTATNSKIKRRINKLYSKEFSINEADEEDVMLVSELVEMDETEIVEFIETLDDASISEVLDALDEVESELEIIDELVDDSVVEEAIAEIEEIILIVEEVADMEEDYEENVDDDEEDEMYDNELDVDELEDPGEEDEEELVDELATMKRRRHNSSRRRKPKTMEDYIKGIPDPDAREFMVSNMNAAKKAKAQLIKKISRNKQAGWTARELEKMTTNQLSKIAKSMNIVTPDYSINSIGGFKKNKSRNDSEGIPLSVNIFKGNKSKNDSEED